MEQSRNLRLYSKSFLNKIKHADEKKFDLRKAIYELDRLSYERGSRSGDYLIREKVREINNQLEIYDEKVKTCETGEKGNFLLYKEIILFFEKDYLDAIAINEKIVLLKQELLLQQEADIEYNKQCQDSKLKRDINNPLRLELERDLKKFENSFQKSVLPPLNEFLLDISDLLFAEEVHDLIRKWSIENIFNDKDDSYYDFLSSINFFIRIRIKIKKESFQVDDIVALINIKLNEFEIKTKLVNIKNFSEQKLNTIILDCAREYCSSNTEINKSQPQVIPVKSQFDEAFETLRNLTEYNKNIQSNEKIPENLSGDRTRRYLYSSPGTGKLLLKDIADYKEDSLIFINDWLLIETKKNPDIYNICRLLFDCMAEELEFFKLFTLANNIAANKTNQKTNMWGELEQYIPKYIANKLINNMVSLCEQLNGAFIKIIFDIDGDNTPKIITIYKKLNIIYDSFNDAQKKIMKEIRQMEK